MMDYIVAIFITSVILIVTQSIKKQLRKFLKRKISYKLSGVVPLE